MFTKKASAREAARASRGAAMLDQVLPGWEQYVDTKTLDLYSSQRCVLAQLALNDRRVLSHGPEWLCVTPFAVGMTYLREELRRRRLPSWWGIEEVGFCPSFFGDISNGGLRRAWTVEIKRRRHQTKCKAKAAKALRILPVTEQEYDLVA